MWEVGTTANRRTWLLVAGASAETVASTVSPVVRLALRAAREAHREQHRPPVPAEKAPNRPAPEPEQLPRRQGVRPAVRRECHGPRRRPFVSREEYPA